MVNDRRSVIAADCSPCKAQKETRGPRRIADEWKVHECLREQRLHAASAERRPLDQTAHARSWTTQARTVHRNQRQRKGRSVVVVCLGSINLASRLVGVCTVGDDGPSSSGGVWAGKSPSPLCDCRAFLALLQLPL